MPPSSGTQNSDGAALFDGRALQTSQDVARFLGVSHGTLVYTLYSASPEYRYRNFEIPKRSGGTRLISAPKGYVRDWQYKLLPVLQNHYATPPNAHGFVSDRSVVSNAKVHANQNLVLNIDLEDFFPSVNFGRVRGLFMAAPFHMGPAAATVCAQICTHRNGLPQGAPTSPVLSNFAASTLDRMLKRLARSNRMRYSRYADDITFSTSQPAFPPRIVVQEQDGSDSFRVVAGEALERAVTASGFAINEKKVRLQTRHVRQSVTGLSVNQFANVERARVRRVRAMLYAWEKFGLENAARHHFEKHRGAKPPPSSAPGVAFRNVVYGELAFIKMVRGAEDPVFLKLCAKLIGLDPNPSKFVRQMAFGADDYDVFISHASEDKAEVARPIFEACESLGLKAFLDEEHIAWGQSFTTKINTALGAARTVLVIVSPTSVAKEWPVVEVNTALSLEVAGEKTVVPLIIGKPDLSRLPLIRGKDWIEWSGDAGVVAKALHEAVRRKAKPQQKPAAQPWGATRSDPSTHVPDVPRRSWLKRLFGGGR